MGTSSGPTRSSQPCCGHGFRKAPQDASEFLTIHVSSDSTLPPSATDAQPSQRRYPLMINCLRIAQIISSRYWSANCLTRISSRELEFEGRGGSCSPPPRLPPAPPWRGCGTSILIARDQPSQVAPLNLSNLSVTHCHWNSHRSESRSPFLLPRLARPDHEASHLLRLRRPQ